jgi:hypothetical protein
MGLTDMSKLGAPVWITRSQGSSSTRIYSRRACATIARAPSHSSARRRQASGSVEMRPVRYPMGSSWRRCLTSPQSSCFPLRPERRALTGILRLGRSWPHGWTKTAPLASRPQCARSRRAQRRTDRAGPLAAVAGVRREGDHYCGSSEAPRTQSSRSACTAGAMQWLGARHSKLARRAYPDSTADAVVGVADDLGSIKALNNVPFVHVVPLRPWHLQGELTRQAVATSLAARGKREDRTRPTTRRADRQVLMMPVEGRDAPASGKGWSGLLRAYRAIEHRFLHCAVPVGEDRSSPANRCQPTGRARPQEM